MPARELPIMSPRSSSVSERIAPGDAGSRQLAAGAGRIGSAGPGGGVPFAASLLGAIAALLALAAAPEDPRALPRLKTTRPVVSVREGEILRKDAWRLAPEVSPDIYEVDLKDGRPLRVTFLSDVDSISFMVEEGIRHDFIIEHGADLCLTRVVGIRAVPAAVFGARYRAEHAGRISVEVPELYELVNVALALTPTGLADRDLFYHDSGYYSEMLRWFEPQRGHPVIAALDAALRQGPGAYATLKMNGYAFVFDPTGGIAQSPVYDRTGFPGERHNPLRPFIESLQAFAAASKFRDFYEAHRELYAVMSGFYTKEADLEGMRAWLRREFPGAREYDSVKVIFSPLAGHHQSATWFESDGFRELQAHVNYPYPEDLSSRTNGIALSEGARRYLRGDIVFTELNHGYINPEADRHAERVLQATSRREVWVDPGRGAEYYGGISLFNEYMNWGLVCLRAVDLLPEEELPSVVRIVDGMMAGRRGFLRFAEFDSFLIDLYRRRAPGSTVADLYPRIIAWFEIGNSSAPRRPAP